MDTVRIKSSHPPSQGPFVIIDAAAFDPAKHELWGEEAQGAPVAAMTANEAYDAISAAFAAPEPSVRSMADLRAEYERVVGKRPFPGWPAETLLGKIAKAKSV